MRMLRNDQLKNLIRQKYPIVIIIGLIFLVLLYNQVTRQDRDGVPAGEESPVPAEIADEERFYRVIDGVEVESEVDRAQHLAAVMIENNSESWPLAGIDKASVVYEVLAEGRIPRFLALFASPDMPAKVGPVRSARTYYLELAAPFDAPYLHVGGSPDALSKIKQFGMVDIDQFFASQYFWRATNRFAPHNVYTSGELFAALVEARAFELPVFDGWQFVDAQRSEAAVEEVADIVVNYTTSTYQAKYVYDMEREQYQRYQAKQPVRTEAGDEVWVDTVIVEEHPHVVYDTVGRRNIDIIGDGKAWVFYKGEAHEATWEKSSRDELTRYYDAAGNEIALQRGKIWINIVEPDTFTF